MTQEELAERANLSVRGISNLERGVRRTPYLDTVRRLADALDLMGEDRAALEVAETSTFSRRVSRLAISTASAAALAPSYIEALATGSPKTSLTIV